ESAFLTRVVLSNKAPLKKFSPTLRKLARKNSCKTLSVPSNTCLFSIFVAAIGSEAAHTRGLTSKNISKTAFDDLEPLDQELFFDRQGWQKLEDFVVCARRFDQQT